MKDPTHISGFLIYQVVIQVQKFEQNLTMCRRAAFNYPTYYQSILSLHFILFKAWGDMEKLLAFCYIILCHTIVKTQKVSTSLPLYCAQTITQQHTFQPIKCVVLYFLLLCCVVVSRWFNYTPKQQKLPASFLFIHKSI